MVPKNVPRMAPARVPPVYWPGQVVVVVLAADGVAPTVWIV